MARRDVFTILLTTFVGMALLYAPQPLFPVLADQLGVSDPAIASLLTWSLVPMAVAPLFIGFLMQVMPPRRVLAGSVLLLAGTEFAFAGIDAFGGLLVVRFLQGALVSTLLTATMTYVSLRATNVSRVMALYVAASVLGGLVGRLLAGYGAPWVGIPTVFAGIGMLAFGSGMLAWGLQPEPQQRRQRIDLSRVGQVLRVPSLSLLFGVVFSAFFVFTALLNFVPFRVSALVDSGTGTGSLVYAGFVLGIASSLLSHRVVSAVGGELRAVALGSLILGGTLGVAWIESFWAVLLAIVGASVGFFLLHSVLSGYVNQHTGADTSLVNGLYVAIYYAGGTAGSYVPGLVYEAVGWSAFLGTLGLVSGLGLILLGRAVQVAPGGAPTGTDPQVDSKVPTSQGQCEPASA
jgi:YNFM family putative membrane transporter